MRLARRRPDTVLAMNMTPMIDVVFLLLIFFMTVSQITEINKERLALPQVADGRKQARAVLTVNVDAQGGIIVSGLRYSLAGLVDAAAEQIALQGSDPGRLQVVVRADRRGASRTVNRIVAALSRLGVRKMRIAVETE